MFPLSTTKIRTTFLLQLYTDTMTGEIKKKNCWHDAFSWSVFFIHFCFICHLLDFPILLWSSYYYSFLLFSFVLFYNAFLFLPEGVLSYSTSLIIYELTSKLRFFFKSLWKSLWNWWYCIGCVRKWSLVCSVSSWSWDTIPPDINSAYCGRTVEFRLFSWNSIGKLLRAL